MKRINDTPRLTTAEANSGLWQELSKHITERLAEKRRENDHDKDAIKTAHLRGFIAACKEILELAEKPPLETEADDGE